MAQSLALGIILRHLQPHCARSPSSLSLLPGQPPLIVGFVLALLTPCATSLSLTVLSGAISQHTIASPASKFPLEGTYTVARVHNWALALGNPARCLGPGPLAKERHRVVPYGIPAPLKGPAIGSPPTQCQ